jgi:hypothetical protein
MSDEATNEEIIPSDLIQEYTEIGLEKLIEESKQFVPVLDNLGSEIPYVKTFIAAVKFPRTLSDFLLGKKVNAFLFSSGLDEAKLEKFKEKFSKTKQERVWERVVFSINAHDDKVKSELIGKLFNSLIDEIISEDEFFAMVHATNSLNVHTLEQLKELYSLSYDYTLTGSQYYSYATLGLVDIDNSSIGTIGGGGPRYPLNQLGWKYVGIVFDFPPSKLGGIKIGEDELIAELDDNGQITNQAFPLCHIQEKGSRYREVGIFVVNPDGRILCDSQTKLPKIIATQVVPAGTAPQVIAQELCEQFSKQPLGVSTRNMEDTKEQKWSFIVKSEQEVDGGTFIYHGEARETLVNEPNKTDTTRYLVDVLDQIVRHTDGELKDIWDKN